MRLINNKVNNKNNRKHPFKLKQTQLLYSLKNITLYQIFKIKVVLFIRICKALLQLAINKKISGL